MLEEHELVERVVPLHEEDPARQGSTEVLQKGIHDLDSNVLIVVQGFGSASILSGSGSRVLKMNADPDQKLEFCSIISTT